MLKRVKFSIFFLALKKYIYSLLMFFFFKFHFILKLFLVLIYFYLLILFLFIFHVPLFTIQSRQKACLN